MSTITVAKKGGVVAIAADSLFTQGSCRVPRAFTAGGKILRIGGSLVGFVGTRAHDHVLRSIARRHPRALDLRSAEAIFETFRKLHRVLVDEYYLKTEEEDESQPYESSQVELLVANPHGIFQVQSYREVIERERFWSIGSGFRFALGAMEAVYDDPRLPASEVARRGAAVACTFDDASGEPVESHEVPLRRPEGQGRSGRAAAAASSRPGRSARR